MNTNLKRNINAFLLSMGLIIVVTIGILGIGLLAIQLGNYLPYVLITLLFIGVAFILSLPLREELKIREQRKQNKKGYQDWLSNPNRTTRI
jgi:F0F1-type ATP synthase assembly protein I